MNNEPTRTVELHPAFWWYCDGCGRKNYGEDIDIDLGGESEREETLRALDGLEDGDPMPEGWREERILLSPKVVKCPTCAAVFSTDETRGDDG